MLAVCSNTCIINEVLCNREEDKPQECATLQIGTMDSEDGSVNWNEIQLAITVSLGVGVSLTGLGLTTVSWKEP